MIKIRTFGIALLNKFNRTTIREPMALNYLDFIANDLGRAEEAVQSGDIESANDDVVSAIGFTRELVNSSEDFDREMLVRNVFQEIEKLLPLFDDRAQEFILKRFSDEVPRSKEFISSYAQQHHVLML